MSIPTDFDGDIYGDSIDTATVVSRPLRHWWGKRRKVVTVEPSVQSLPTVRNFFLTQNEERKIAMAYTRHGYRIAGTSLPPGPQPEFVANCGGPGVCRECNTDSTTARLQTSSSYGFGPVVGTAAIEVNASLANGIPLRDPTDYSAKAKAIVLKYMDSNFAKHYSSDELPAYEVNLVWFCKTLQNWKAIVITDLPDSLYFEVIYNGDKHETYLHAYDKTAEIVIPD